ncbi:MAG: type IV pilus assembly protein PilM [Candidatus Doudnabacteria bacterium]|nr:type IV pilus assembly protein PilM [Candidatus Doudnabacteria bacterium]
MLFSKPKSHLGVDIGTSNIKIVQLRPHESKFVLETYGLVNVAYQLSNRDSGSAIQHTAEVLKKLLEQSQVTTNRIVASLPNSVVFTSVIEIPKIPDEEIKSAIESEAKKYVPLPLEEVALSWITIQEKKKKINLDTNLGSVATTNEKQMKILLTAVPTIVVDNYLKVFTLANLEPVALEIEAVALIRSLVGEDLDTLLVIDIGAKNTSINLVDNGYLKLSKNLGVGGDTITTSIAQSLNVSFVRAEQFKKDFGLSTQGQQLPEVMKPILDIIKSEAAQLIGLYESRGDRIDKVLLSGAGSKIPSLSKYFASFDKPIVLANPWARVLFPEKLVPVIQPLGLNLAVAAGLAMREK